jgi:hypothetical protein
MDSAATLIGPADTVTRLAEAATRFIRLVRAAGLEVLGAGWVRREGDGSPYLYLVTPLAEQGRSRDGYALIQSVRQANRFDWPDLHSVKLIGPDSLVAQELVSEWERPRPPGVTASIAGMFGPTLLPDNSLVFHSDPQPAAP